MIATDIIKRRWELWRLRLMQFEARADKVVGRQLVAEKWRKA